MKDCKGKTNNFIKKPLNGSSLFFLKNLKFKKVNKIASLMKPSKTKFRLVKSISRHVPNLLLKRDAIQISFVKKFFNLGLSKSVIKKSYMFKKKKITFNYDTQNFIDRGALRLLLERSKETIVTSYELILSDAQLLKTNLNIFVVKHHKVCLFIISIVGRIISSLSINGVPDIEVISCIQKTLCMDLPSITANELITTLTTSEITRPQVENGSLLANLAEFGEIVVTLRGELQEAETIANSDLGNAEVRQKIEEKIAPELWARKQRKLCSILDNVTNEYNRLEAFLTQGNEVNPHRRDMQQHIDSLVDIVQDVTRAINANSGLAEALIDERQRILIDREIPDNVSVPASNTNVPISTESVVSDITPFDRLDSFPVVKSPDLLRDLLADDSTRTKLLEEQLPDKLNRFAEITSDLFTQLYATQEIAFSNHGDVTLVIQNAESVIRERLVPERWENKFVALHLLLRKIRISYLRVELLTHSDNYPYSEQISQHIRSLEETLNIMEEASRGLKPLQRAMITWRRNNGFELVFEPDHVGG